MIQSFKSKAIKISLQTQYTNCKSRCLKHLLHYNYLSWIFITCDNIDDPHVSWYYFGINYFHLYNDIGSFWFDCAQITNNNTLLSSVHDRGWGVSEPSHILPKVSIKFEFKLLQYLILLSWFKLYTLRQLQN